MPRRPYERGELRSAVVTAARALVAAEGVSGLTVREAAASAGVSHAAARRHFADDAELVAAVAVLGFDELGAAVSAAGDRLHGVAQAYVGFAVANPALYRLMFDSGTSELAAAGQRVLAPAVAAARGSGEPAGHDATVLVACVLHGLCSLLLAGQLPAARSADLARTVTALVESALAAR
ncbi:TetR/AcrR family transcriptional regulator [Saccharothrix hoggarensis]|uniref:TetR/AcrR family transcriptional regulator n=1 Tax=Saccharothrix hoggarensis TaxID=913853 RepID=A0ABW3QXE5_9PSEU